jgi:hypothetical protein
VFYIQDWELQLKTLWWLEISASISLSAVGSHIVLLVGWWHNKIRFAVNCRQAGQEVVLDYPYYKRMTWKADPPRLTV